MGLGVGRTALSFESDDSASFTGTVEGSIPSVSVSFELSIGGTIAPGLVIGGGLFLEGLASPESTDVTHDGPAPADSVEFSQASTGMLALLLDYYFDPTAGLHGQLGVGLAGSGFGEGVDTTTDETVFPETTTGGFGLMVGIGYEWWVGSDWGIGVLGRAMFASTQNDDDDSADEHYRITALAIPSLLFTATYH